VTDYASDCDPLRRRGCGAPVLFNTNRGFKKRVVSGGKTAVNSYDKQVGVSPPTKPNVRKKRTARAMIFHAKSAISQICSVFVAPRNIPLYRKFQSLRDEIKLRSLMLTS